MIGSLRSCSGFCHLALKQASGHIEFFGNIALLSGGGAYITEAEEESAIVYATFLENVASRGGGMALRDCVSFKVHGSHYAGLHFKNNRALAGGALYVDSRDASLDSYTVRDC